jgi:hypothetical protein
MPEALLIWINASFVARAENKFLYRPSAALPIKNRRGRQGMRALSGENLPRTWSGADIGSP